jgi:carboxyl-terminal processing protease
VKRSPADLLLIGLLVALPAPASAQGTAYEQLQAFSGVLTQVRQNYVDSVEYGSLIQASIRGLLSSLDPHSRYVSRRDYLLQDQWNRGELAGPSLRLENSERHVIVVSAGGNAAKSGIQPGDRLLRINDTTVAALAAEEVELRLLGDKDSKVRLSLQRGDPLAPDTFTTTVERERLEHVIVGRSRIVAPGTGYVHLTEFVHQAAEELEKEIRKLQRLGARQLILDLRGNPGGDIGAVVEIASRFLPPGTQLFRVRSRRPITFEQIPTARQAKFAEVPLVILVDVGTASAAEILAGALQDHDRAVIVGRRTFGKAVMQTSLPLPNGDMVWLTTARIFTPSGRLIQRRYKALNAEQYNQSAGQANPEDTTVYRTSRGREVRGGGGILPDVVVPSRADLPVWFSVASDSGYDSDADSVANRLLRDSTAMVAWASDSASWQSRLVTPFLERTRTGLGISVVPDPAVRARLGLLLAERTAFVRWGETGAAELSIRNDPDIHAALAAFARIPELLRQKLSSSVLRR